MDQKTIDNLFSIDIKTKNSGKNRQSGTGLGLMLAKEFAEKNKGKLYFESELDKGSTFFIRLPISN